MEQTVLRTHPSLCDVCRTIDISRHLDNGAQYPGPSELGPFQEILQKEEHCPLCRLVIQALSIHAKDYWKANEYPVETCFLGRLGDVNRPRLDVWFESTRTTTLPDGYSGYFPGLGRILPLLAPDTGGDVDTDSSGSKHTLELECGRRINPEIDVSLVREWMDDCNLRHGTSCTLAERHNDYVGLMLIDVQRMCLVSADWSVRYVALSYVWGKANQVMTLSDNMYELREDGALQAIRDQLPRLIQDAIAFVAALGERYLWVDALCIVQDDGLFKALYLPRMGTIYGRSVLTLIALSGQDADAPLPGLTDGTRKPSATPQQIRGLQLVARGPGLWLRQQSTAWHTRAWTFQEAMLSKKRLYVSDTQMYWQCSTCYRSEDSTGQFAGDGPMNMESGASPLDRDVSAESDRCVQFKVYEDLVRGYSWRAMTFPSDSVDAFLGVLVKLAYRFDWEGFVSALPEAFFELALLWSPMTDSCTLRQPRAYGNPDYRNPPLHPCRSPTWCWSAWTGHMFWNPWRLNSYAGKPISIKSEVGSGFIFNGETGGVQTLMTREGDRRLVSDDILSRGDPFSATALNILRDMGLNGPGQSTNVLFFEAATQDVGEDYSIGPPSGNRASAGSRGYFSNALRHSLWIYDKDKRHCGSVRGLSEWNLDTSDRWITYGLVLLSRAEQDEVTDQDVDAWKDRLPLEHPSSAEYYKEIHDTSRYTSKKDWCLNILLVRWLGPDGYAERLAIGEMHADAWDSETRKEKVIALI